MQATVRLAHVPCPSCGVAALERWKTAAVKTKGVIRRRIWRCTACGIAVLTEERIVGRTHKRYVPVPEKETPGPTPGGAVEPLYVPSGH